MSRVNKTKVLLGGAMNRKTPSKASCILSKLNILSNDVLDYGCVMVLMLITTNGKSLILIILIIILQLNFKI